MAVVLCVHLRNGESVLMSYTARYSYSSDLYTIRFEFQVGHLE